MSAALKLRVLQALCTMVIAGPYTALHQDTFMLAYSDVNFITDQNVSECGLAIFGGEEPFAMALINEANALLKEHVKSS